MDVQEALVEAVVKYPCIWDQREKTYRDARKKEAAWDAVRAEVGGSQSIEDLKKMFKGLRDYYVREKKKLEKRSGGAGGQVDSS